MANYPIKLLKDETNAAFVPLVSTDCIRDKDNQTLQQILDKKLGPTNLLPGDHVSITTEGNNCYVSVDLPAGLTLIDNLNTTTANQGSLDAHQGKVLKDMIPEIIDDITDTSPTKGLSANQGYLLNQKFNDYVTTQTLTTTLNNYSTVSHSHGLLNNDLTVELPNTTIDSGWSMINPSYNGFLLKSIRGQADAPDWFCNSHSAGIAFGGADTKGVLSMSYASGQRITKFAGGNGTKPVWWYGIQGATGKIYNLEPTVHSFNFTSSTNYSVAGYNKYVVVGKICFVTAYITCISPVTTDITLATLPKPVIGEVGNPHWQWESWESAQRTAPLITQVYNDGGFRIRRGVAGQNYFVNFSYPIQ